MGKLTALPIFDFMNTYGYRKFVFKSSKNEQL